tara:strand:+ start:271 stop:405 length:135 start_codon:yes stop_codon:yes gene_type:complete
MTEIKDKILKLLDEGFSTDELEMYDLMHIQREIQELMDQIEEDE